MTARTFFAGVAAFNSGCRFRDNPYHTIDEMLGWYEGWSTGFDITWRKLTLRQRFEIVCCAATDEIRPSKPRRSTRPMARRTKRTTATIS